MAQITGTIFGDSLTNPFILVDTYFRPIVPTSGFKVKVSLLTFKDFIVLADEINAFLRKHFNKDETRFTLELDQSTTCTGISLCEENERILCIFDFSREGTSTGRYEVQLKSFVRHLIKDLRLCYMVTEKPLPPGAGRSAKALKKKYGETSTKVYAFDQVGSTLRALLKEIRNWDTTIPELNLVPIDSVLPQVWRQHIPNFDNVPYRNSKKESIANDIMRLYPRIEPYIHCHFNNSFDGIESLGIHYGYKKARFAEDGSLKNFSSTITKATALVIPKYVNKGENNIRDVTFNFKETNLDVILEDEELSFFDNVRYLLGERDAGILKVSNLTTLVSLLWRLHTDLNKDKEMYCIVCKKSYLTKSQQSKLLKDNYCFTVES